MKYLTVKKGGNTVLMVARFVISANISTYRFSITRVIPKPLQHRMITASTVDSIASEIDAVRSKIQAGLEKELGCEIRSTALQDRESPMKLKAAQRVALNEVHFLEELARQVREW